MNPKDRVPVRLPFVQEKCVSFKMSLSVPTFLPLQSVALCRLAIIDTLLVFVQGAQTSA